MNKYQSQADDVEQNTSLGPFRKAQELRKHAGPALRTVEDAAKAHAKARDELATKILTKSPVKAYDSSSGGWRSNLDLALMARFEALPPGERSGVVHALATEPWGHTELCEAILRLPNALVTKQITPAIRAHIKQQLLSVFDHDAYETISAEIEEMALIDKAFAVTIEAFRETLGGDGDVLQHAPTLHRLAIHEGLKPIGWGDRYSTEGATPFESEPAAA